MEPKELGKEVENGKVHDGLLHKPYVHLIRKGKQRKGYVVFVPDGKNARVGFSLCKDGDKFSGSNGIGMAIKRAMRKPEGFEKVPYTVVCEYSGASNIVRKKFPMMIIGDLFKF